MATYSPEEAKALPSPNGIDTNIEVAVGAIAGAAAGAIGGPVGAIVGAGVGTAVALLADRAFHDNEREQAQHDHELDDIIGVTKGSLGAEIPPGFLRAPDVAANLRAEHDELEDLASKFLLIVEEGDRDALQSEFSFLETRLLAHLTIEETVLLPRYAEVAPSDARTLREEHEAFRQMLDEINIALDLHLVRLETVRDLIVKLAAHAHRENVTLYRWAANDAASSF